jgi:glycosyltransferase A (GT-A) superfamily protein (DUF2064 family)
MHITIIAKAPVSGRVKTRLCPPCTPQQAADVAAAALADTFAAVDAVAAATGARRVLLLDGEVQPWMPTDYEVIAQRGDGLGARLQNGFVDAGPGVIIGMETPHAAPWLEQGLAAVRAGRNVLGPATDGGYWMIGLCAATVASVAEVFRGVPMSSAHTGAAQLRALHRLGREVTMLPTARDIDDFDDLLAVAAARRGGRLGSVVDEILAALAR